MNIAVVHAQGLAYVQTEAGADCPQFTWAAKQYLCLPNGAHKKKDLAVGGFHLDSDLALTCLVAQFNQNPTALREAMLNTQLTYLSNLYKIDRVTIAYGGKQIRIECTDLNQAA